MVNLKIMDSRKDSAGQWGVPAAMLKEHPGAEVSHCTCPEIPSDFSVHSADSVDADLIPCHKVAALRTEGKH